MSTPPNILLIMTDQQRFDTLAAYGFDAGHTPHLDALADEGVVFDAAYCTSPLCTPSRASILTGKHVAGHGVQRLYDVLPDDERLIPEHLRARGYRTGLIGKLHVSSQPEEMERRHPHDGFDVYELCNEMSLHMDSPFHAYARWVRGHDPAFHERLVREGRGVHPYPAELHMSRWAAERTVAFIEDSAAMDTPFFALMSLFDPHNPYDNAPDGYVDLIGPLDPVASPSEGPIPRGLARELASKTPEAHDRGRPLEDVRRGYHASLAFADEQIGRVLERLEQLGIADDTLVVFTSDHGDMLGDRGLMTKGAFFYEPCVRVPLLLRWRRRIGAPQRVEHPVQLSDIAATVLTAAGVAATALGPGADSRDLVGLSAQTTPPRPYAVSAYRNGGLNIGGDSTYFDPPLLATMLRSERFKLCVYHDAEDPSPGQLFDLAADPGERVNLWDDPAHRSVREQLVQLLLDWSVGAGAAAPPRGGERLPLTSTA